MFERLNTAPKSKLYLVTMMVSGVVAIVLGSRSYGVGLILVSAFFYPRMKRWEAEQAIRNAKKPADRADPS